MDAAREEAIAKQRRRRKRVKRIKNFIVFFLFAWIICSMLAIIFLGYRVFSLQRQLNDLSARVDVLSTVEQEPVDNADETGYDSDSLYLQTYYETAEENLAQAGDTLKVYLTFDDGPSDNTDRILDILDDYNIKATFFVVGKEDEESLEHYKRIVDEGHTIAMHSYSHNYSDLYASLDSFKEDLERIRALIFDTTGVWSDLYRFPGGSSNQVSNIEMKEFIAYLNHENIRYLDWNVASGDATSVAYSPDELVENVMSDVVKYKTSVVLMHDGNNKDATVEALPALIEQLQAVGAVILPVSEDTNMIQHITVSE